MNFNNNKTSSTQLLILVTIFACLFTACHQTEIPVELQNNEQAIEYLTDLDKTVTKFNNRVMDLAVLTGGKDINNSDSLTTGQKLKLAKIAGQFMLASKKIEELIDNKSAIESTLNESELKAFTIRCRELENKMGNLNFEELGLNEEQIAGLKQKFDEYKIHKQQEKAYNDSLVAEYNLQKVDSSVVEAKPTSNNKTQKVTKANRWKIIAGFSFGFLVILFLVIVAIIKVIRIIKSFR